MNQKAYYVENLSVIRGEKVLLHDVSVGIERGKVTVILGPNGAGKSTLLSVLAGDINPDVGLVRFLDRDIRKWSTREFAQHRAVLPQQTILQFAFRSREVVAMGRLPLPPESRDDEEIAVAIAMDSTETSHLSSRPYTQLSGGEQSRVSFARVLAQETPVVLLDEPTASLDLRHQHDVMNVAREIAHEGGTVIAIVHDINLACTYADTLLLMDGGEIVATGSPWDVAKNDILQRTFGCPMAVMNHPYLNCPLVLNTETATVTPGNTSEIVSKLP